MGYLSESEIAKLNFIEVGKNVLISDKASIYGAENMSIGNDVRIDDFCILTGKIKFGNNIHIAPGCIMYGGESGITMEDFSGLAFNCTLVVTSDDYTGASMTNPTVPREYKHLNDMPVRLCRHVILGTGTIVLPGVTVGEGACSGAMTTFTKDTEEWAMYIGSPARKIKERKKDLLSYEKAYLNSKKNL